MNSKIDLMIDQSKVHISFYISKNLKLILQFEYIIKYYLYNL